MRKRATSAALGQASQSVAGLPTLSGTQRAWQETLSSLAVRLFIAWIIMFGTVMWIYLRGPGETGGVVEASLIRSDYLPTMAFVAATAVLVLWSCFRARPGFVPRLAWAHPGLAAPAVLLLLPRFYDVSERFGWPQYSSPHELYLGKLFGAAIPFFGHDGFDITGKSFPVLLAAPWSDRWYLTSQPRILAVATALLWAPVIIACLRAQGCRVSLLGVHGYGLLIGVTLMHGVGHAMNVQYTSSVALELTNGSAFFVRAALVAFVRACIVVVITAAALETGRLVGRRDVPLLAAFE